MSIYEPVDGAVRMSTFADGVEVVVEVTAAGCEPGSAVEAQMCEQLVADGLAKVKSKKKVN